MNRNIRFFVIIVCVALFLLICSGCQKYVVIEFNTIVVRESTEQKPKLRIGITTDKHWRIERYINIHEGIQKIKLPEGFMHVYSSTNCLDRIVPNLNEVPMGGRVAVFLICPTEITVQENGDIIIKETSDPDVIGYWADERIDGDLVGIRISIDGILTKEKSINADELDAWFAGNHEDDVFCNPNDLFGYYQIMGKVHVQRGGYIIRNPLNGQLEFLSFDIN